MKNKGLLIGAKGTKALSLTNDGDWVNALGRDEGGGDMGAAFRKVAWLHRGVMLRAQAVGALPFAILKGEREVERSSGYANRLGFFPDPTRLLALVEAALTLYGYAYLFVRRNRLRPLGLRYLDPSTIEPIIDERAGLTGFKRALKGGTDVYEPEDLIYFWGVDPFVEIGHPRGSAASAALAAANVLMKVDEFAAAFFERGAIKATVFSAPEGIPEAERLRFRDWLRRFFGGGLETAHAIEVLNADRTEATVIGEGIHELADNALTREKREDIATALGVPHSLLFSNAANYATARQDELHFQSKTVLPEAEFIQQVLNDQLFMKAGYRFEFRPEELSVFQEEEVNRAQAFGYLAEALPVGLAMRILGFDLPADISWQEVDELTIKANALIQENPSDSPLPNEHSEGKIAGSGSGQPQSSFDRSARVVDVTGLREDVASPLIEELAARDMGRWKRKVLKSLKAGKGVEVGFESEWIPDEWMAAIRARLEEVEDVEGVRRVFATQGVGSED